MTWLAGSAVRHGSLAARRRLAGALVWCSLAAVACGGPPLEPGAAVEGSLEPGEHAEHRLDLEADRLVRLIVEPVAGGTPPELSYRVLAPSGGAVAEVVGVRGKYGGVLAWVTAEAGRHRLEVSNPMPLARLGYRITLEPAAPAGPGDEHRAAAMRSNAAANRAYDRGDEQTALELLAAARDRYERAGDARGVVEMLRDMSEVQSERDPDEALQYAERGLEVAGREGLAEWSYKLLDWRGLLLAGRDYEAAKAAFERGIEIARRVGDAEAGGWEIALHLDLGRLEAGYGHRDRAAATFERALVRARELAAAAERSQLLFRKHPEVLIELAGIAEAENDPAAAHERLQEALRLALRYRSPRPEADALHALGNLEGRRGRFDVALDHFTRCAEINAAIGDRLKQAQALLSQGLVLDKLRLPERARPAFERALRLAEERGSFDTQARARLELGRLWQDQGEADRAEAEYHRGLELARRRDDVGRTRLTGLLLYGLGRLELDRGRSQEAVATLRRALADHLEAGDPAGEALTRAALGTALARTGEPGEAIEQLGAARELATRLDNRFELQATLLRLARVQAASDRRAALATLDRAIAVGHDIRRSLSAVGSRTHFSGITRRLYGLYVELLMQSGQPAPAFAAAEEGRSRALLDLLAEAQFDLRRHFDPELQRRAADLEARLDSLQARLSSAAGDAELMVALERRIERVEGDLARAEAEMRSRSPRYRALRDPETLGVEAARALLGERQRALEYWLGEQRSFLFVLGGGRFEAIELPPESEIRRRVDDLRSALEEIDQAGFATAAHWLYAHLVQPGLEPSGVRRGAAGVEELVIVPDGVLHRLPFGALISASPPAPIAFSRLPYLVRDFAIGYAPSLSTLAVLERAGREPVPVAERSSVLFADSVREGGLEFYCPGDRSAAEDGGSRGSHSVRLPTLEGARLEVSRVASRSRGPVHAFIGEEATEARLRSAPVAAADRLHFAVHGLVCESYPERSGLVLSSAEGSSDDGFLQMREIYALDLSADLAVLSACESGAGREVDGEGVVNLARAFFYAGVPSVVVSLWAVSDATTAELMDTFYAGLEDGEPYSEALRQAQLAMISRGGRPSSPRHWAPLVLIGRTR